MYQLIIVDDENKLRHSLAQLFPWQQFGFEVSGIFANGKDAYDYCLTHRIDLILSDIRMPIMDGLALAEKICSEQKIKLIFFSGFQDFEYLRAALKNGVFDYLLKPVRYEDLSDCLLRARDALDRELGATSAPGPQSLSYYEKIIDSVKKYIEVHYQDATLEQAARLVALSPNYLSKIFREHADIGFSDYLLKTRMENAARMLRDIGYKQYEIAYRVGYDNPKNFSRAFHQFFQCSPSAYRNQKLNTAEQALKLTGCPNQIDRASKPN